ncbi:hypothetical protein TA3x_005143 [Tundrisphaera sp. TA3]|uniref:hypothetical protein n=1 Tax=Tundrisphaera sp. TA3 TaxID=3435775 RepID=UPI003EBC2896
MSDSNPVSEGELETSPRRPADPKKNPSYPPRVHLHEKPKWLAELKEVENRIGYARQMLASLKNDPKRPSFERIYAQMQGARDQVADAVRRLPQETGDLYHEDHHRVADAQAALKRLFDRWESLTTSRA